MSVVRLIVSPEAEDDLEKILNFLEHEAGRAVAYRFGQRFRARFRQIQAFPESGALRPALGPRLRICAIVPYVVFYRAAVADDAVVVLRILHGRRDISARLFMD